MISKTTIGIAAAGICAIGYCIYFDKKRRSDPNYRQKVTERRKKAANRGLGGSGNSSTTKFPDPTNEQACQAFFMQEIQLGEILMTNGQLQEGVEHLANAVVVCGQPQHLMGVFAQTLPQEVIQLLALRIPHVKKVWDEKCLKTGKRMMEQQEPTKKKIVELAEDDVE